MKFELQPLPYDVNALETCISGKTMTFHHDKHLATYVNNLNNLIAGSEFENADLDTIVKNSSGGIFNNAAQVWNHNFYFESFLPNGKKKPTGDLLKAIEKDFGSFENFQKELTEASIGLFGSGWAWLAKNKDGKLEIIKESNAGNPLTKGYTPLCRPEIQT